MSMNVASETDGQPRSSQLTQGYETLMKGMMNVVLRQIELTSGLLEGGMADLNLLTQANTPDKFIQAELEILRRQSERVITAAQKFSQDVNLTWSEASEASKTFN